METSLAPSPIERHTHVPLLLKTATISDFYLGDTRQQTIDLQRREMWKKAFERSGSWRTSARVSPSMAITISIPRVVFVLVETSTVLGLANAVINTPKAIKRKAKSKCLNLAQNDDAVLIPLMLDIFNSAVC